MIDLEETCVLDKINVIPFHGADNRYYLYDLYTSIEGENWELIANKTSTEPETSAGEVYVLEGKAADKETQAVIDDAYATQKEVDGALESVKANNKIKEDVGSYCGSAFFRLSLYWW